MAFGAIVVLNALYGFSLSFVLVPLLALPAASIPIGSGVLLFFAAKYVNQKPKFIWVSYALSFFYLVVGLFFLRYVLTCELECWRYDYIEDRGIFLGVVLLLLATIIIHKSLRAQQKS